MTENQKEMIKVMRNLGHGYKSIAKETGLKLHAVRDYCRYHGLTGNAPALAVERVMQNLGLKKPLPPRYCPVCGELIIKSDLYANGGRLKKYCSDKCKHRYWDRKK